MNIINVDFPTWYCMRQCRESINYLTNLHDDKYRLEIDSEKKIYKTFMDGILKAA